MSITVLLQNLISRFLGKRPSWQIQLSAATQRIHSCRSWGLCHDRLPMRPVPFRFFARILQTGILREVLLKSGENGYIITGIQMIDPYLTFATVVVPIIMSRLIRYCQLEKSLFPSGKRHWYFQYRSPGKQSFHR